jgi:hypothetical protein
VGLKAQMHFDFSSSSIARMTTIISVVNAIGHFNPQGHAPDNYPPPF